MSPFGFGKPNIDHMKAKRNIKGLAKALSNEDCKTRLDAVEALGCIGGSQVVDPLIRALKDPQKKVKKTAIKSMSKLKETRVRQALIDFVDKDRDIDLRLNAIRVLGEIHDSETSEALASMLCKEKVCEVEQAIMDSLGKIGDGASIQALVNYLEDNRQGESSYVAQVLEGINDPRVAEELLCVKNPNDCAIWIYRIGILDHINQFDKALECCGKALKLEPNNSYCQEMKLALITKINPKNEDAWLNRGNYELKHSTSSKSAESFRKAIEASSKNKEIRDYVVRIWLDQGKKALEAQENFDNVIFSFKEAFNLDRSNQESKDHLLKTLLNFANFELNSDHNLTKANSIYEEALKVDPFNIEISFAQANIFATQNDFKEAKNCMDKILEIDPNNECALEKKKDYEKSIRDIEDQRLKKQQEEAEWQKRRARMYEHFALKDEETGEIIDVNSLTLELIMIGRYGDFISDSLVPNPRARKIGEMLNQKGGKPLMQQVWYTVERQIPINTASYLSICWKDIGGWQH